MWKAISPLLLGLLLLQDVPEPAAALLHRTDPTALLRTWKIKGVLSCPHKGHSRKCLWVENAFPCGIIEVVQRPGATQVLEAQPWIAAIRTGARHGEGNLRFSEARVHTVVPYPPNDIGFPFAKPSPTGFRTNYVSEFDGLGWRTEWWDLLFNYSRVPIDCERNPGQPGCAGTWGAIYPRSGFVLHQSEPTAAYLQAVRAGRVANAPAGRVVLDPYPFEPRRGHYLQLVKPVPRPAVAIGYPGLLELGSGSISGSYLFLHLGIFDECRRCLAPRLVGAR